MAKEKKHGWFFRHFGYLFNRDEWIRTHATYEQDMALAAQIEEEKVENLKKSLLTANEELGRVENEVRQERESWREKEAEYDEELRKRRRIFHDWKMCTFYLDPNGVILDVEPKDPALVADYFGADPEDVIGRKANQIIPDEKYFNVYTGLVMAGARDFAMKEKSFESNTIEIGGEAFDIMAYPDWSGDGLKNLKGSVVTVVPLRQRGWLEKLKQRQRLTIDVAEEVGQETALDYCLTMMKAGTRPVYFNFANNMSISRTALNSIAKFYKIAKAQDAICVFSNVPTEAADVLTSMEIEAGHIKGVRTVEGYTLAPETNS